MSTALLTTTTAPTSYSPRKMDGSDDEHTGVGKGGGKSRRELPAGAVAILKAWLLSPEHFTHPYPTPQDQIMLMEKTGIDKKQLKNWFTNARRRIWKPMLKKQLEAGKLAAGGAPGGGVQQGGPAMAVQLPPAARQQQQHQAPQQEMYSNFQQAQIQSEQQYQPQQVQYQEPPVSDGHFFCMSCRCFLCCCSNRSCEFFKESDSFKNEVSSCHAHCGS